MSKQIELQQIREMSLSESIAYTPTALSVMDMIRPPAVDEGEPTIVKSDKAGFKRRVIMAGSPMGEQ